MREIGQTNAANSNVSNAISFSQTQDGYLQQVGSALDQMSTLAVEAQDATKTNAQSSRLQPGIPRSGHLHHQHRQRDLQRRQLVLRHDDTTTGGLTHDRWRRRHVHHDRCQSDRDGLHRRHRLGHLDHDRRGRGFDCRHCGHHHAGHRSCHCRRERGTVDLYERRTGRALRQPDRRQQQPDAMWTWPTESTKYAEYQILVQSGTSMLAQANQNPQSVLKLLS